MLYETKIQIQVMLPRQKKFHSLIVVTTQEELEDKIRKLKKDNPGIKIRAVLLQELPDEEVGFYDV